MSSLFRSTIIKGNRLTDFTQTTATVGTTIPFGVGTITANGNCIWAALPPTEHMHRKRQGKGGTKTETYTYTMSYAVAFVKGPVFNWKWIKRDGKVVMTTDPAAPVEDQEYSTKWLEKATIYNGVRSQAPDSTIEAREGVGRVSAFKDLGYIVVEDDDVTAGGGAVPNYEACVNLTPPEAFLTSKPYRVEINEAQREQVNLGGGNLRTLLKEEFYVEGHIETAIITGGRKRDPLRVTTLLPEGFTSSPVITGGRKRDPLRIYDVPGEGMTQTSSVTGGRMETVLIIYEDPGEELEFGINPTGGRKYVP